MVAADFTTFALSYCDSSSMFLSKYWAAIPLNFVFGFSPTNLRVVSDLQSDKYTSNSCRSILLKCFSQDSTSFFKVGQPNAALKISIRSILLNLFFCLDYQERLFLKKSLEKCTTFNDK